MDLRKRLRGKVAGLAFLVVSATPAAAETLAESVRAAVTSNPTAQAANFDVQISALELLELKREFQPKIGLYGEAGAETVDAPDRLLPDDNGQLKGHHQHRHRGRAGAVRRLPPGQHGL